MSQTQKSIAVLTSGGDAPGMNAAVRAVVRAGINKGMKVYGVYRGYNGLLNGDVEEMNLRSVSDIIGNGGTMLYTARSEEYATPAGIQRAADFCRSIGVSGVVVIGGDGSFRGARCLTNAGINCIGVPGTIDNDIACSEYTVGFDTAMNTAIQMVDRIRDTAQSHDRCSVVEVMGRRCGDIALQTGIATGATAILVPEVQYNIERDVIARIINTQKTGKKHFIVVVAEGVGGVRDLAKYVEQRLGIEQELQSSVMYSVAVLRHFVTELLQARWALRLLNFLNRISVTELLQCRAARLLILISTKHLICLVCLMKSFTRLL